MANVRLESITKCFDDKVALSQLDLEIEDQEFFVLLGHTGAGKTTTLRCIAGLEKLDQGDIYFDNQPMTELDPASRDVAFVFQSHILYPHLTAFENMAFPLWPRKLPEIEVKRRVQDVAEMLHIEHLLWRKPAQLSGGETQRVGLGRAMVRRPRVFLMDEPISNLDAKLRAEMRTEIKWRQKQLGITTLYVTHDQIEAMSMADRVAILDQGKIMQIGTPIEVYNQPANIFVAGFIGNPSMNLMTCRLSESNGEIYGQLIGHLQVALPETIARKGIAREEVWLGIHPENLVIHQQEEDNTIVVEVHNYEALGAETIVDVNLGLDETDQRVTMKCRIPPDQQVRVGQTVWLELQACSIFDRDTGQAIKSV